MSMAVDTRGDETRGLDWMNESSCVVPGGFFALSNGGGAGVWANVLAVQ